MSVYAVTNPQGERVGSIMKFVGEEPATRWWAFSVFRRDPNQEHKAGFPTRKEAVEWLLQQRPA